MNFSIWKMGKLWAISPAEGPFTDRVIGTADAIEMVNAFAKYPTITGKIKAIWGLDIIESAVFDDPNIIRGLSINKAFCGKCREVLVEQDYVFVDFHTKRPVSNMLKVFAIGHAIRYT